MLSSVSKLIFRSPLPSVTIKPPQLVAWLSSKTDSTSPSTGDTHESGKDIHDPTIDASHQSGTMTEQQRVAWEKKDQGVTSHTQTRQERVPPEEKDVETRTSNS